jgi:hypothetical protein
MCSVATFLVEVKMVNPANLVNLANLANLASLSPRLLSELLTRTDKPLFPYHKNKVDTITESYE